MVIPNSPLLSKKFSLHKLKQVICRPNSDSAQPAKTLDLTATIMSAINDLQGNFLNGVSKAIDKLNKHGAQLSKAILALQEQVTALQSQAATVLTCQGSQTARVRKGPIVPYTCYRHRAVLT